MGGKNGEAVNEWESLSTGEDPGTQGEWVEGLVEGMELEGELVDAFLVPDNDAFGKGKPRVAYVIKDAHGVNNNLGERAGLRGLRDLPKGSLVKITVTGKDELGKDRNVWRFSIQAQRAKGQPIVNKLVKDYKALQAVPF